MQRGDQRPTRSGGGQRRRPLRAAEMNHRLPVPPHHILRDRVNGVVGGRDEDEVAALGQRSAGGERLTAGRARGGGLRMGVGARRDRDGRQPRRGATRAERRQQRAANRARADHPDPPA